MVRRALIDRRPWLLASIVAAVTWWALAESDYVPGLFLIVWKAIPLACLAIYAFQRHLGPDGTILSGVMAIAAISDAMTELQYVAAGTLMAFSLLLAIWLYMRNRRAQASGSQLALAGVLVLLVPGATWMLLAGEGGRLLVTGYALLLAIMAATAWTSRFSRYRVGLGAMLFVGSDLILFATNGPLLRGNAIATGAVWPLYYAGQLLIATGVVGRLRRDRA